MVDSLELQANDILALHSVVRDKLPLVLEVNRASDILQALRLKAKFKLNLVLLSAEEAPLVLDEIIKADVPLSELFGYITELRTLTSGRATASLTFSHYDPVPKNIADTVIAESNGN